MPNKHEQSGRDFQWQHSIYVFHSAATLNYWEFEPALCQEKQTDVYDSRPISSFFNLTWHPPLETVHLENIDLSQVLPRINDINLLPFGLVKMDLTGKVLEYNMAEAELTGTDPNWAVGKNFFDEVATCTNTPAFYGKFVEGVKKGFLNAVFNYSFTHQETPIRVRVHMVTMPDSRGQKIVVMMVTRVQHNVHITDAFQTPINASDVVPAQTEAAASLSDAAAKGIANAILSAANHQSAQSALDEPVAGRHSSGNTYR